MRKQQGILKNHLGTIRKESADGIRTLFDPWVEPPEGWKGKKRERLFSPLRSVLALPGSSALLGGFLSTDRP